MYAFMCVCLGIFLLSMMLDKFICWCVQAKAERQRLHDEARALEAKQHEEQRAENVIRNATVWFVCTFLFTLYLSFLLHIYSLLVFHHSRSTLSHIISSLHFTSLDCYDCDEVFEWKNFISSLDHAVLMHSCIKPTRILLYMVGLCQI